MTTVTCDKCGAALMLDEHFSSFELSFFKKTGQSRGEETTYDLCSDCSRNIEQFVRTKETRGRRAA